MPTTRVLLLRHAETAAPDVWHGEESDIGLSHAGHDDARRAAMVLATEKPVAVVSSAMRRAIETAKPIAEACGVPLQIEPDFRERSIGQLCGQPFGGGSQLWTETLQRWMSGETGFAPPGAESFDALGDRVLPGWRRLASQYAGTTYVVVAHGGVIRCLLMSLGLVNDWNDFRCANLAVHELRYDGMRWGLSSTRDVASPGLSPSLPDEGPMQEPPK